MPEYKLQFFGQPILRRKAREVEYFNEEVKTIIDKMFQLMQNHKGIGLAANQIGLDKRIIAINVERPLVLINPKILEKSQEKIKMQEGCLSFPNIFLEIERPKEIEVEAIDRGKKKIKFKVSELLARVIQHELDHLDGVLMIDYLSFWQRLKLRPKLFKIKKLNKK